MEKFALILLCLVSVRVALAQEKTMEVRSLHPRRAAVLFANQNYEANTYDLQKTYNDAEAMKAAFERLGFTVLVFERDVKKADLERLLRGLAMKLTSYHTVCIYYSGHGGLYNQENYIIPVDTPVLTENADIQQYGVSLNGVYNALHEAAVPVGIVVSDACRNMVVGKGGTLTGMVLPTEAPTGTFTMFATRSGKIARENSKGQYSYFTQELLKHLETPGLTLEAIFKRTREGVKAATAHFSEPQVAGYVDELGGDYVLKVGPTLPYTAPVIANSETQVRPPNGLAEPAVQTIAVVGLTNGVLDGFTLAQETATTLAKAYPGYRFVPYQKGEKTLSTLQCDVSEWTEPDPENQIDPKLHKYKTRVVLTVRQNGQVISTETLQWGGIDYRKETAKTNSVTSTLELTRKLTFKKQP
jgi:hypothetical protein